MAATSTLVRYEDPLDGRELGAIAGFLAGYSGNTRVSYTTDLRLFAAWCADSGVRVLRRAHLETFARSMEQEGRCPGREKQPVRLELRWIVEATNTWWSNYGPPVRKPGARLIVVRDNTPGTVTRVR